MKFLTDIVAILLVLGGLVAVVILGQNGDGWQPASALFSDGVTYAKILFAVTGVSLVLGIALGWMSIGKEQSERLPGGMVRRHGTDDMVMHWIHTVGFLACLYTGIALLKWPIIPNPFNIAQLYTIHFLGAALVVFGCMVFVGKYQTRGDSGLFLKLVHFKYAIIEILEYLDIVGTSDRTAFGLRWPKAIRGPLNGIAKAFGLGTPPVNGKYTATETSLSFFGWSILTTLLVTTGLIKASKYLFATPAEWLRYATTVHDAVIPIVLILLAAHALATILIPANVPMFTSMFTGKVKESWVKEQLPAWYEKLQKESVGGKARAARESA